jgi:hypothetical protein
MSANDPKRTWQTHAIKPTAGGWLEAALRVLGWSAAFNSPLQRFRAISPEHLAGAFSGNAGSLNAACHDLVVVMGGAPRKIGPTVTEEKVIKPNAPPHLPAQFLTGVPPPPFRSAVRRG